MIKQLKVETTKNREQRKDMKIVQRIEIYWKFIQYFSILLVYLTLLFSTI